MKVKESLYLLKDAVIHSYSQIFFSMNQWFGLLIILVTFFQPAIGLNGLLAVLCVNILAWLLGFSKVQIKEGIFGFNAVLMGLCLGYYFVPGLPYFLFFVFLMLSLLLVTAVFQGALGKVSLPFLSFPFLVTYWIMMLSAKHMQALVFRNFSLVESIGEPGLERTWYELAHCMDGVIPSGLLLIFFKTIAATFFQNSVLAGLLIAIGLFLFSRIAFTLAFSGFAAAFWVYNVFGADVQQLSHNLVGSNYIFFAIAIGAFYLVPNIFSYLAVWIMIPVLLMIQVAGDQVTDQSGLKTYTLAFSLLTVLMLYALHQRWMHKFLHLVTLQYYSAEKTVYKHLNSISRFRNAFYKKLNLPFWGDWFVSQGYDGTITHLGDYSKAIDFVIVDEKNNTYREPGIRNTDFYCYQKPVLAAADGYVYDITDFIDDNEVGEMDTARNWGNSILIHHLDGIYTQYSHLKKENIKVSVGDYVTAGTIIGLCGSSGRSPEPHLHFQVQTVPRIGGKTLSYPFSCYLEQKDNEQWQLQLNEIPKLNSRIKPVEISNALYEAFRWLPEKQLRFYDEQAKEIITIDIHTDAWNRSYLFDPKSNAYAYFVHDGNRFYFTDFEGSRKSFLFHLYASCYHLLLADYTDVVLNDQIPLFHFQLPVLSWVQDVLAPFYLFTRAGYESKVISANTLIGNEIILQSKVEVTWIGITQKKLQYKMKIEDNQLKEVIYQAKGGIERWVFAG